MSWHHGHSKEAMEESKRPVANIMSVYDEPGTWSLQYRLKVLCCQQPCPYYGGQGKGRFGEHWQYYYAKDFWENWPGHGWREFNEYLNDNGRIVQRNVYGNLPKSSRSMQMRFDRSKRLKRLMVKDFNVDQVVVLDRQAPK